MNTKKPLIQSLERAMDILEIIRDSPKAIRATDVAEKLDLGVATAHNIIRTLYMRGYLAQDDNSRYLLGPECFKLFSSAGNQFDELRRIVSKYVQEAAACTGDTTFFGSEYFGSLYCVYISTGTGQIVVSPKQKWLDKLHSTGAGKVIIAHKGIEWYRKICKKTKPEKFTSKTIVKVEDMEKELPGIIKEGYAISNGECFEDVAAFGIPVYDKEKKLVGALAQSIPSFYLESGKINIKERVALLNSYAEKITSEF